MALDLTFDPSYGGDSSGVDLTFDPAFKPKKQNKGIAGDTITDLKRGIEQIPGIVTGLADIPIAAITGDTYADKAANVLGDITGFQPSKWAKDAEAEYSPKRRASSMAVDKAWQDNESPFSDAMDGDFSGIGNIAKAYAQNPLHTLGAVVESLPSMAAGGLAGRAAVAASKIAPVVGGAMGEGAVMAGQQMTQLTESGADPRTAAAASLATGVVGVGIGAMGGKLAQTMGIVDPETVFAGGAVRGVAAEAGDQSIKGMVKEGAKRVAGGAMSEGFFEELPQSVLEQTLSNLAQGKPWDEGVSRAAVEGTLAGSLMGGAFNVLPPSVQAPGQQPPDNQNQNPLLALPAPTYTGTPGDQIIAADTERQAAIDKAQAEADALYAARDAYELEQRRGFPGGVPTITNDPAPIQQRIDALLGINQARLTGIARSNYEKALEAAFNEQIGFAVGKDSMEIPVTMGDYLASKVAAGDIDRNSELGQRLALRQMAGQNATNRLQQLADEETMQQPDIAPIPVVGPISAAANVAVQSGVSALAQAQQVAEQMAQQKPAEQAPASTNPLTAAMQQGGISAAVPEQVAQEAPQTNDAQAASFDVTKRTDKQLEYLTQHGQPGWKEAAVAELQKRGVQVSAPQQAKTDTLAPDSKANQNNEATADKIFAGKKAAYAEMAETGAPADVVAVNVMRWQGRTNTRNEPMNLWRSKNGALGLTPANQKSPFVDGVLVTTMYPEANTEANSATVPAQNAADSAKQEAANNNTTNGDGATSQPPKQQSPAQTEEPKVKKPLSVGVMPGAAEPITVKDGVVHIGKYPAQNFDTGEDVTVPAGATDRQVVTALKDAGAIAGKMRVFGLEKEAVTDTIGWTSMTTVQREGLLIRAGYGGTGNRRLNLGGAGLLNKAWEAIGEGARNKIAAAHEAQFKQPEKKQEEEQPVKSDIDAAAHEAATSPKNDTPTPTEAQIEAGNYKKGHITLQGLNIAIENPEGSTRSGTDQDGKAWQTTMQNHYGYIKRTEGNDGDQVDVFIGPNAESEKVFIVDQKNPKTGAFDEHKVMLGFDNMVQAKSAYAKHYESGWMNKGVIAVMPLTMQQFKNWLKTGDTSAPYSDADQNPVKNEKPDAATVPDETNVPEQDPIKKDAAVNSELPPNFDPDVQYAKNPDGSYKTKGEYTPEEWAAYTKSAIDKKLSQPKSATASNEGAGSEIKLDASKPSVSEAAGGDLHSEIDKTVKSLEDERQKWIDKDYKYGKKVVRLKGDGPSNKETMTVGSINRRRRDSVINELARQIMALKKLKDISIDSLSSRLAKAVSRGESTQDFERRVKDSQGNIRTRTEDEMIEAEIWREFIDPNTSATAQATKALLSAYRSHVAGTKNKAAPIALSEGQLVAETQDWLKELFGNEVSDDAGPVSQPKTDAAPEAKQEQAPAITPQHVENGEAETATAAVVEQSLKKGAANSPLDLRQERDLLLKKVDAAIAAAPTAEEKDAWNRVEQRIDLTNNMHVADTIGYRIFDVPGDGKFKVLNLKEALQRFRERVEANPGFKKPANTTGLQKVAPWQRTTTGGTEAMTKELLDSSEWQSAVEYAKQIGKPLLFGQLRNGSDITAYTEAKPFEHEGYDDFKMVSARAFGVTDKVAWAVIDLASGLTVSSGHPTRLKAIVETNRELTKYSPQQMATAVKSAQSNMPGLTGTQDELERRWLDKMEPNDSAAPDVAPAKDKPAASTESDALDAAKIRDERQKQGGEGAPAPNSAATRLPGAPDKAGMQERTVRAVNPGSSEPAQSKVGAGSNIYATDIPVAVQGAALEAARKEQDRLNDYDLQEEIRSLSENGGVDLSPLTGNPAYWDAENEEFTESGFNEIDRLTAEKARENLRLPALNELSDLDGAHQFAQVEAMEKILDGLGIAFHRSYSFSSSRYIMVSQGGDKPDLKLRFSDHLNTARGQPSPDVNVAPGGEKFVDAVKAVLAIANPANQVPETNPEAPASLVDQVNAAVKKLFDGELNVDELKAAFALVRENRAAIESELSKMTKDELLRGGGAQFAYRYKSENKPEVVKAAYGAMLDNFIMGESISYAIGGRGDWIETKARAIAARVNAATPESLAAYADKIKASRSEREQRLEKLTKAMKDPQTLEDYRRLLQAKVDGGKTSDQARMELTPEQRVTLDNLWAEDTRSRRVQRNDAAKTEVRVADKTTTGDIIETKHTKTGADLFVVKAAERVERDVYNQWNAAAKKLGGWYSSFRGNGAVPGFQFKTRGDAAAFLKYLGGDATAAQEAVQEKRDAFADDRSQSAAERLTEMADRLDERADESMAVERKANTARRARFAASAEAAARSDKALAKTMRNIAEAIAAGKAKFLDRVRQKAQVEMLRSAVKTAQYAELQKKYQSYVDQERHRGEKPGAETADYARWPTFTAYRSDLAVLGRELSQIDGAKKLGQALLKVADDVSDAYQKFAKENLHKVSVFSAKREGSDESRPAVFSTAEKAEAAIAKSGFNGKATTVSFKRGEHLVIMGPTMAREAGVWSGDDDKRITLKPEFAEEIVAKNKAMGKRNRLTMPYVFDNVSVERASWNGLGIESAAEMRAALREFIALREAPAEDDKIKAMERAMIGRKNDGLDFFPTPAGTAQSMIDAAEIAEGMSVLEPSAGMGHIAEQIREVTSVDPDVIEFNSDRRELLEAKGFNVVGNDFMEADGQYDRILMNPPFSNRRDAEHVQHAYSLLKPGGRLVAIMGEGVFFGQDAKAKAFREWLDEVGGTSEKLEEGTFLDPSLPVNTATNARMVVVDKAAGKVAPADNEGVGNIASQGKISPADKAVYGMVAEGKSAADILKFIASASRNPFNRQVAKLLLKTGIAPKVMAGTSDGWRFNAGNDKKYAAAYNEKTDTIALFRPAAAERNFVHEAIHAATIRALGRKGLAAGQMKALFAHVQKTGKLKGMYGMSDVDEFVAEAFSNPKFQDALKQVAAPKASGALSSAWNWFVRIVKGILGLPENQENALSQALEIGLGVMRENMRLNVDLKNGKVRGMPDNSTASGRGNNAPAPEADIGEAIKAGLAIDTSTYEVLHDDDPRYPFFAKNKGDSSGRAEKSFQTADDTQQWIDEKQKSIDQENREVIDLFKRGVSITEHNGKFDAKTKSNTFAINEISKSEAIRIAKVRLEQEAKQANDPHEIPMYIRDEELPAVRNGYTRFWHGSGEHATITEINEGGLFGGLFAAYSEDSAHGPGDPWRYYYIDVKDDDIASHDDLVRAFYKNEKPGIDAIRKYTVAGISKKDLLDIAEKVLEDTNSWILNTGDNYGRSDEALRVSELLYVPIRHEWPGLPFNGKDGDDGQLSWFMQRVRGAVAKAYGFKAVKMNDEHGISVLVLPGNKVNKVDLENPEFDFSKFKQSDFKTWRQFKNEPTASAGSDAIRYNVAEDGWSVAEPSKMDDVIYALQDKQIDMKRVVQSIKATGKKIRDNFNPYLQEELFHGRAAKGVKDFLDFELRPLLKEMQQAGVDMGDFEEFLWNRHAEERNRQIATINPKMPDGGSGIKTEDARAYLSGLSAEQKAKYESLAKRIDAMNKGSQQVLVESGLESADTVAAWNGAYQSYVPLQREDVDSGHVGTGKGFSIRGSASKRAMGSGKKVVDIIANIAMQRERNIVRAEKNRVSNALMGLALENPNADFWKVDQAPKERVVEERAIYTVRDAAGKKLEEFTRMDEAERFARQHPDSDIEQTWGDRVQERIEPGFKNRDNVVLTRVNGKDHYIIFNERDERAMRMAQSLKNLDVDNMGRVLSVVGKATRYLASINTQYNPVFGVINLIRDAQGALLNLTSTPLAGDQKKVLGYTVDALRGIYADIRAHRRGEKPSSNWANLFEEFQKEGGQTGYRDQYANAESRAEAIKSELEQFTDGKAKQLTRGLFGWLSDYNETMENAVRLATYKAGKERGLSNQQAASLAKNITVNFNRKGQMATQVGALYAFFNASVQGTARIAETLFEQHGGDFKNVRLSRKGKQIVVGGILLGSMQALLLAAAGYGDDEPPDFVRERNLILPIGDGKYLTLAMPLGFHVIPGTGRIATEFVMSGFKDPLKRIAQFGSMFAEAFNPVGNSGFSLQTITPSVVDPLAALAENKDFTGKEIYRENFNSLNPQPGHARAKDVATVWSRVISESLNWLTGGTEFKPGLMSWSPDAIDYLIGQAGGGVMREANKLAQTVGSGVTGEDLPLYKIPLVGRFVGDTQGQSGQSAKFYDAIKQINMHEAEYKGLIKDGRRQEAMEYMAENPAVKLMMAGNHAESTVRKLRSMKRDLVEKDAGQDQIRAIDDRITATMRAFNERAGAAI